MRIKENRPLAYIVLAAVVISCTLLSGGIRLKSARKAALSPFFAASESISADLTELGDNAYVLLGIAKNYPQLDEALLDDTQAAIDELRAAQEERDIPRMYQASRDLTDCVEDLYTAGGKLTMQGNDADDFRYKYKNFSSANLRIAHDPYNDAAAAFNEQRSGFPAALIAAICGIAPLGAFS